MTGCGNTGVIKTRSEVYDLSDGFQYCLAIETIRLRSFKITRPTLASPLLTSRNRNPLGSHATPKGRPRLGTYRAPCTTCTLGLWQSAPTGVLVNTDQKTYLHVFRTYIVRRVGAGRVDWARLWAQGPGPRGPRGPGPWAQTEPGSIDSSGPGAANYVGTEHVFLHKMPKKSSPQSSR